MEPRTAPPRARRPRRRAALWFTLAAPVAIAVVAGGLTASNAKPAPGPIASGPRAATPAIGIPPPSGQNQAGIVVGKAAVAKALTTFELPVQVQRVYASVSFKLVPGNPSHLITTSEAWVVTDPGPNPGYGIFPPAQTTILGFGVLPVTATLYLTQVVGPDGNYAPIVITNDNVNKPPNPSVSDVEADVDVRVGNVAVDNVPLDVGPACRTATPAHLSLRGEDKGGHLLRTDYNPFFGGPLAGVVSIPPFSGCGAGGQDLDPLLTGTISGPGNAINLFQGPLGAWDTTSPNDCASGYRTGPGGTQVALPCKTPASLPVGP